MNVLCLGHATWDTYLPINNYPKENTKNRIEKKLECGGGPASNAAYLLGKWGIDVDYAGVVGNDLVGNKIKKELSDIGVGVEYLELQQDMVTTTSYIMVNQNSGSRTSLAHHPSDFKMSHSIDKDYDIVLVDGEEYEEALMVLSRCKISVIDAGRCTNKVIDLCKKVDYVVCSKDFALVYTGKTIEQLDEIFAIMNKDFKCVVITLEDKGCAYYNNGVKIIPSIKVKAVDSTGAGDLFHGAFVYGLTKGWELPKILVFANIAGALSVTKLGGRNSVYPVEEVRRIANEFVGSNIY